MTIVYHPELEQGSDEWKALRCGTLTASEMKLIITPTLKIADNDKTRCHLYELAAQRVTKYVEPQYISDDMLRGQVDELEARMLYDKHYAPVHRCGFVTNDRWGFVIGYSPDGLVEPGGVIECKSRRQKYQMQTIAGGEMPDDYLIQVQTGLLVTERSWCDFVTYCGGMPMCTMRVYPDDEIQKAIVNAATAFYDKMESLLMAYEVQIVAPGARFIPTERKIEEPIEIGEFE